MHVQSIKKLMLLSFIITALLSCNNGPTLQTYFVDNELKPGFTSFDIPTSVVNVDKVELSDQQRKAYASVDKLNVLAYKIDTSTQEAFKSELAAVKAILDDSKYDELVRGGNSVDGKFVVKFLGEVDRIDELIIFGSANDKGFVVARILGDGMNARDLMSLRTVMDDINFDDAQLGQMLEFFK